MPDAPWPPGFERVPDAPWTRQPLESLALKYDSVERHGWYANLDPTVEELAALLRDGDVLVDYSGGTGILMDRLLQAVGDRNVGMVNVDSSPKFLRLSLEKLRHEPRAAFRLIEYLKDERRLQYVDEVLGEPLLRRGVDALASTNAIHLYFDLHETLRSWWRVLRPGGRVHVQSGNVGREGRPAGRWIIDDTVEAVAEEAARLAREDPRWAPYRAALDDAARMEAYEKLRRRIFLPVRPARHYLDALEAAGFRVLRVEHRAIPVRTREWFDFLAVYAEGVLGWVGGAEKVDGRPASPEAARDRLDLLREALDRVIGGRERFDAEWTYVTAEKA